MKIIRFKEVHDEREHLVKIIAERADTGEHVLDAIWDPHDKQTPENRENFRVWVRRMLTQMGYEITN